MSALAFIIKVEEDMKSKKLIYIIIGILSIIIGITGNKFFEKDTLNKESAKTNDSLKVTFLDVGQGDCTIITCGEETMIIDGGDNSKGYFIKTYLEKYNINDIKYMVATHPDADHIGGLDVIGYNINCENVLMTNFSKETKTYEEFIKVIKDKNYNIINPVPGDEYILGDAVIRIVSPVKKYNDANNMSIGILLIHGENSFLFLGDCEEEGEMDILAEGIDIKADVYKVSHHGSSSASSIKFLEKVEPEYGVISVGEGNSYGHPHSEVLNNLRKMGVKVFRTDIQGTIIVTSDGETLKWNMDPDESWLTGK